MAMTTTVAAVIVSSCLSAAPPVFSDLPFEEARDRASDEGKLLLVDATAVWCAPCQQMDRTTWVDEAVVEWLEGHAIAVQVDVDEQPELAESLGISAMPTMIAFREGEEFDRVVGYRGAEQLLAWLEGVRAGRSSLEALREEVDADPTNVQRRYDYAKKLAHAGRAEEASEEFVWLWEHMLEHDPAMTGVRVSFMASDMERLAQRDEGAKRAFKKLRDRTQDRLEAEPTWDDLTDWIVLNNVIGDAQATLAWIDRNMDDEAGRASIARMGHLVNGLLLEHNRWDVYGMLVRAPVASVEANYRRGEAMEAFLPPDMDEAQIEQMHASMLEEFRREAGQLHAGLLAADRVEEAWQVAEKAVELDDSPQMRAALVELALRAGEPRERHRSLAAEDVRERLEQALAGG